MRMNGAFLERGNRRSSPFFWAKARLGTRRVKRSALLLLASFPHEEKSPLQSHDENTAFPSSARLCLRPASHAQSGRSGRAHRGSEAADSSRKKAASVATWGSNLSHTIVSRGLILGQPRAPHHPAVSRDLYLFPCRTRARAFSTRCRSTLASPPPHETDGWC